MGKGEMMSVGGLSLPRNVMSASVTVEIDSNKSIKVDYKGNVCIQNLQGNSFLSSMYTTVEQLRRILQAAERTYEKAKKIYEDDDI